MTAKPVLPRMTRPKLATPNLMRVPKSRGLSILGQISGDFAFRLVVTGSMTNLNVRSAAMAAGWDGKVPLMASITVEATGIIGSTSTAAYAFDTDVLPNGSRVTLVNKGYIVGKGGRGKDYSSSGNAESGGPALRAQAPTTVDNLLGVIGGGGGGGDRSDDAYGGGGGGAGYPVGSGGNSGLDCSVGGMGHGSSGTLTSGGGGGRGSVNAGDAENGYYCALTGVGMSGGNLGNSGGEIGGNSSGPGAGGAAVTGNANITWIATGTRYGTVA
jgi:hypothetical protein